MTDSPVVLSLKDPLSQVTRSERKLLLGTSAVAIFIASTGLIPTKISTLGVDFGPADQRAILIVTALVVAYFLVAFFVYGLTDYLSWRVALDESKQRTYSEFYLKKMGLHPEIRERGEAEFGASWLATLPRMLSFPASIVRGAFEFVLPLMIGIYVIYALIQKAA